MGTKTRTIANNLTTGLGTGDFVHIKTLTAGGVSTLDFIHGTSDVVLDSTYNVYKIIGHRVDFGTTHGLVCRYRVSGSFIDAGYETVSVTQNGTGTSLSGGGSTGSAYIRMGWQRYAGTTAGLPAWIGVAVSSEVDTANTNRGSGGADPALSSTNDGFPNTAATDGTVRALTEDGLLSVIKACYVNGSNPNVIMMGPTVKQQFSKYMFSTNSRIATPYQDYGKNQRDGVGVVGAVDVYVSDFGVLDVVPNRLQRQVSSDYVDVFVLDSEYAQVKYLDDYRTDVIATVGDAERRMLLVDYALCIDNPGAHGIFADVDDDAAMTAS